MCVFKIMILVDIMLSLAMCSSFPVSVLSMEIPSSGPQSLRSELDSFDDKDTASLPTIPGGGHFVHNWKLYFRRNWRINRYCTDFLQGFFCTTKLFVKNFRIWLKISLKRSFQRPDLMSQKIRFCKLSKEVPILSLWIDRFWFALTAAKSHLSQHHFCGKIV